MLVLALAIAFSTRAAPRLAAMEPTSKSTKPLRFSAASVYDAVAPAVIGVRSRKGRQPFFGSGTIVDPKGLVLASSQAVPDGARGITAFLPGGATISARVLFRRDAFELVILQLDKRRTPKGGFPYVRLGDSQRVHLGAAAFGLGNAFHSIELDDQVSFSQGIISGRFDLKETLPDSTYLGAALETSAPVNDGMAGGPLVDSRGELIGLLCKNFSRARWLGTAVPIHRIKPLLSPYRGWFSDRDERFDAYLGVELEEFGEERTVRVLRVFDRSPAAAAGLNPGVVIVSINDTAIESITEFRSEFAKIRAGGTVRLGAEIDGTTKELTVTLWGRL